MNGTGIIRRIDDLGRVVIPKEIRRTLKLEEGDPMEIFCADSMVLFKKYYPEKEYGNKILELIVGMDCEYDIENHHEIVKSLRNALQLLNLKDEEEAE